ncbi:unnamed protein product [Coregonus sp. 'balchen']|nr:unnamed protein product [Coregonus sp. 'balchen']
MKFKNLLYPVILAPAYIPELNTVQHTDEGIVFGASCSLTLLGDVLKAAVGKLPPHQTEVFAAVLEQLRWFAGLQIRNVAGQYFAAYKQSPRREDDISIVTSGMSVTFAEGSSVVKHLALSYGGMAATTVLAKNTASRLIGKQWKEELLQDACSSLAEEMTLHPSAPGGMVTYRRTLTLSLFYKFYLTGVYKDVVRADYISATEIYHHKSPSSVQIFQAVPDGQKEEDVVGRPMMHLSAMKQATGEAVYCDDIPLYENELYLCLITSTKAHAHILSIDTSEAESMPGVVSCVFAKDIPGSNMTGPAVYDETVTCVGHIIGAVVADTQAHAQRAAKAVRITYQELQPSLVAKALGVPASRVVVRVKRMGGGFGGKESRSTTLSTVVAVAAYRLKRPVRCMLDRDEDMLVTGGRHPFYGRYKVGLYEVRY